MAQYPLRPETREYRIQRDQPAVHVTASQRANAILKADLYYAATIGNNPEAREQLRLLASITVEAHENFMRAV